MDPLAINQLMSHQAQPSKIPGEALGVVHADHLVTEPLGGTSVASCAAVAMGQSQLASHM